MRCGAGGASRFRIQNFLSDRWNSAGLHFEVRRILILQRIYGTGKQAADRVVPELVPASWKVPVFCPAKEPMMKSATGDGKGLFPESEFEKRRIP